MRSMFLNVVLAAAALLSTGCASSTEIRGGTSEASYTTEAAHPKTVTVETLELTITAPPAQAAPTPAVPPQPTKENGP